MDNRKLKQPKKYAHSFLDQKNEKKNQNLDIIDPSNESNACQNKTKQIQKLNDRKVIKKKNEPSALRLAAINQTFHKIEDNANAMIKNFKINQELFQNCLDYSGKVKCKCNRNIKYFCLKCMFKNPHLQFPSINLPFNIRVIHHSSEKINKSSIVPMCLLSQQISVEMFNSNTDSKQVLKGVPRNQTCILFPHKKSSKVCQRKDFDEIKNIVILDCTWFQTDQLVSCLQKQGFNKFVRLEDYQSLYWRYNHHSDKALSSAEALVYFLKEYQRSMKFDETKFDNIMFLYCLNLKIVEGSYRKIGQKKQDAQQEQEQRMSN